MSIISYILFTFLTLISLPLHAVHHAEPTAPIVSHVENTPGTSFKININTATLAEIQTLKGLGVNKAQALIAYRTEHGKFQSVADLQKVKGIGEKLAERIAAQVVFD